MADETTGGEMPQDDMPPVNYLPFRGTLDAEDIIGGEAHAVYAFHAVEGQTLTVRLTARGNTADFSLSFGTDFNYAESIEFGTSREAEGGRTLSGKVPKTGLYFLGVTGSVGDAANFHLHVTLK